MTIKQYSNSFYSALVVGTMLTNPALAVFTSVVHQDIPPHCDRLFIPTDVDEIGDLLVFPPDESLEHIALGQTPVIPCPQFNNTAQPEELVQIINFTGRELSEVWYVANVETRISNYDGYANDAAFPPTANDPGRFAFRIDNIFSDPNGGHHPLVFESGVQDGVWQPFEIWQFVLQDYSNTLGIAPDQFNSFGVGNASTFVAGTPPSSGSIIAIPRIPEPGSIALVMLSLVSLVVTKRWK